MTPASRQLYTLAERVVQPYTALPTLRAAMITGSVAKEIADSYSDIDMTFYYADELPPEEDLHALRRELGGSERKWTIGDHAQGSFAEAFHLAGVEVQIGHTTIANWEQAIASVMEELDTTSPTQKALEGTLACKALYGEPYIARWKEQIAAYPDALAEAMVTRNLSFFPLWGLQPHFDTRDARLWFYQSMVESAEHLVAILAGLNKLYFTTFQFKRMRRFAAQMTIKPVDFEQRLDYLFTRESADAARELERLVEETLDLVDLHMPHVDTSQARARLGWRVQPWAVETAA